MYQNYIQELIPKRKIWTRLLQKTQLLTSNYWKRTVTAFLPQPKTSRAKTTSITRHHESWSSRMHSSNANDLIVLLADYRVKLMVS